MQWCEKLNGIFKDQEIGTGEYEKNDPKIYEHINKCGSVKAAIAYSKRRMQGYRKGTKPSQIDPGTTVFVLVEELMNFVK